MSPQPPDIVDEIRRLYYETSQRSIERDLQRAITLFKTLPTEEAREQAAVFMDGLSQMRSEWAGARPPGALRPTSARPPGGTRLASGTPRKGSRGSRKP